MHAHQADSTAAYDGNLQMFREQPHSADLKTFRFWRWLAEQGRLEHDVAGPAGGEDIAPGPPAT